MHGQVQKYALYCWGGLSLLNLRKWYTHGNSCQPYHGSADQLWDFYNIFWEHSIAHNCTFTFAFNSNLFRFYNEINYITMTFNNQLCLTSSSPCLIYYWIDVQGWTSTIAIFPFFLLRKEEKWSICFSYVTRLIFFLLVIVIYSCAICFLFSFMTFFNFKSL